MPRALVTGAAGLVGSTACTLLASQGWDVVGVDNDQRGKLFAEGSVDLVYRMLDADKRITMYPIDLSADVHVAGLFRQIEPCDLIIHTAGQPSHDYSAQHPIVDFVLNAQMTLLLLEETKRCWPEAVFVFCSTNKVYGDFPITVEYKEWPTRYAPVPARWQMGFDESVPLDGTIHSPFGVSKAYADLITQEYGLYYGLKTACFRCGCITGAAHQGVALHGFLAYLMRCAKNDLPYTIIGWSGKQVRDNIHAVDLVRAFLAFYERPTCGAVYNMGGGRANSISVLEAISRAEELTGKEMKTDYSPAPRKGDHKWWVTDTRKFERNYPGWRRLFDLDAIFKDLA